MSVTIRREAPFVTRYAYTVPSIVDGGNAQIRSIILVPGDNTVTDEEYEILQNNENFMICLESGDHGIVNDKGKAKTKSARAFEPKAKKAEYDITVTEQDLRRKPNELKFQE